MPSADLQRKATGESELKICKRQLASVSKQNAELFASLKLLKDSVQPHITAQLRVSSSEKERTEQMLEKIRGRDVMHRAACDELKDANQKQSVEIAKQQVTIRILNEKVN